MRIAHSWTISSRSVNEFSVGYNRFQNKNNITDNAKFTPQLGIPGVPDDCFPPLRFTGHNPVPPLFGVGCKNIDPSESYIYQDTFSYLRGKHGLKFGGEFRRYRYNTYEPGALSGDFTFTDRETSLPGFTTTTGHPFASFILGAVDKGNRAVYTTAPEAKGTPAAPYPLATRGHFYSDEELARLPREAGFAHARVTRDHEWGQLLVAQP